jgi:small-conductance mechanosensitive channel
MDKKITLSIGFVAALIIQILQLLFLAGKISKAMSMGSSLILLFVAVFAAILLTNKYYVAIMQEFLVQGLKTVATVVVFLFLYQIVSHFFIVKNTDLPRTTMGILLVFGMSGFLSSLVCSFIVANFNKK